MLSTPSSSIIQHVLRQLQRKTKTCICPIMPTRLPNDGLGGKADGATLSKTLVIFPLHCQVCYSWMPHNARHAAQTHQAPEIMRVPLEAVCLQTKAAMPGHGELAPLLSRLLTPPLPAAVASAVGALKVAHLLNSKL